MSVFSEPLNVKVKREFEFCSIRPAFEIRTSVVLGHFTTVFFTKMDRRDHFESTGMFVVCGVWTTGFSIETQIGCSMPSLLTWLRCTEALSVLAQYAP